MKKEYRPPWIDVLAAILATFESLLLPFALIVAGLVLTIILFRILFL